MSTSRQRYEEKRRRRQKRQGQRDQRSSGRQAQGSGPCSGPNSGQGTGPGVGPGQGSGDAQGSRRGEGRWQHWRDGVRVEQAIEQLALAVAADDPAAEELLAELTDIPTGWEPLQRVITRHWVRLQAAGWTVDVGRHAVRRLGARHARWLVDDEPADLRTGLELVAWLLNLPALPSAARVRLEPDDARLLDRVRALLSKAESTEFPEEAEALTAKAQELVSRHALHQALAEGADRERPGLRHILLDDPYADAKSLLVNVIAKANRCRAVCLTGYGVSTVLGFETDLRATELLYASLLVQATRAMTAAGSAGTGHRQPSYRRSFLVAYAHRIGERLDTASAHAVEIVADDRLLPVLAARRTAVDDAVGEAFPELTTRNFGISNHRGWAAGRAAADRADLAAFEEVRAS